MSKFKSGSAEDYFLWLWNNRFAESVNIKQRCHDYFVNGIEWASMKNPTRIDAALKKEHAYEQLMEQDTAQVVKDSKVE